MCNTCTCTKDKSQKCKTAMKKVFVVSWKYSDGSRGGVHAYMGKEVAQGELNMLRIYSDTRDFELWEVDLVS